MPILKRRTGTLLLAAFAAGVFVLPFLVYLTGVFVLGRYSGGGALGFFGDFLRGLAALRWHSWVLAAGPAVLVALWLGVWRMGAQGNREQQ